MENQLSVNDSDGSTRERIFLSAAQLFSQKGYNGVSMRELAEHSGISKPTIYYYFGNKEGIYTELVQSGLTHGEIYLKEIFSLAVPVKEKLVLLTKFHFDQGIKYPEFAKFLLSLVTVTEKLPFLDTFMKAANKRKQVIIDLVKEGIALGEFGASADPDLAAEIFMGSISHFLWKQVNCKECVLSHDLAEQMVELLFKGLNE
jgi:TetR/AcrR family transcriptional regulator